MFRRTIPTVSGQLGRSFRRRIVVCLAALLVLSAIGFSQANQWTWQSGTSMFPQTCAPSNNYCAQPGVYGTRGTTAPGNTPGSRAGSATSTDSQGNLWLFGGSGMNDLWKFDASLQQWAWISGSNTNTATGVWATLGVPADANVPSPRQNAVSWFDSSGNYSMFGGSGQDSQGTPADPATGRPVGAPLSAGTSGGSPEVYGVAFSPDGKLLASADGNGYVQLWDPVTGQPVSSPLHTGISGNSIFAVAFSPNGKLLASAGYDGTIQLRHVWLFADPYAALCADVGPPTITDWNRYASGEPRSDTCADHNRTPRP